MPINPSAAGEGHNPVGIPSGDVVCFGFLTYCLLMMVDDLPPKNGGALVVGSVETVGDDAAIVACILSGWGVPTRLVSTPVGADHYGGTVLEHLKSWGVDTDERVSRGLATPLEVGILDATGGRTYFQRREPVVLDRLEAPTFTNLAGAGLLYVDWYDGPRVVEAMETAFSQGVPVFLNLESQYQKNPGVTGLLEYASICQVSMDEPGVSGSPADIARSLIGQGVGTALVTLGADGCVVAQGQETYWVRTPAVKVLGCYGAGAAFSAGIIYGLRRGWPLENCARLAAGYAGLKCQVAGIAGLSMSEIQETAATLDVRPMPL